MISLRRGLLVVLLVCAFSRIGEGAPASQSGLCIAAHDGDTITVQLASGRVEKVRLIGVDAAEMGQGPWAIRARDFIRARLMGQRVRLELDVAERDRYGRLLAYVWLGGELVNRELVRRGLALMYTVPPNVAHADVLLAAQREARDAGRGIWDPREGLAQAPSDYRRAHRPMR